MHDKAAKDGQSTRVVKSHVTYRDDFHEHGTFSGVDVFSISQILSRPIIQLYDNCKFPNNLIKNFSVFDA